MNAIGGMKIFRMSDCDWWVGPDAESVKKAYMAEIGLDEDEFEGPEELTNEQVWSLRYFPDLNDKTKSMSFMQQLTDMVRSGIKFPCFFATTEF